MIWRLRIVARCVMIALLPSAALAQRATIVGRVIAQGTDVALGYSVVSLTPGGAERFTDAAGRFALSGVQPGRIRISAKHIGYAPLDTSLNVSAGDSIDLRLELALVSIQLPVTHTLAPACGHPGESSGKLGVVLATLLEQLKQNAERNRLLSRSYPFELEVERKMTKPEPALEARFIAFDTVYRSSQRQWRYKPGGMLGTREYAPGVFGGKWTTIIVPELADFADDAFLSNHCFDFGGIETEQGDTLVRIEFVPAQTVHSPDVSGTILLDARTYQIRVADLALVNPPKQLREQIGAQSIRVKFKEILPGVPIADVVTSVVYPSDDPRFAGQEPATERQLTLSVRFLKGKP